MQPYSRWPVHDDVIWNRFPHLCPSVMEIHGHQWFYLQRANNAKRWSCGWFEEFCTEQIYIHFLSTTCLLNSDSMDCDALWLNFSRGFVFHVTVISFKVITLQQKWCGSSYCKCDVSADSLSNLNTLRPTQNGHSPDDISNASSWMKIFEFRLLFHCILFRRVLFIISQHGFI